MSNASPSPSNSSRQWLIGLTLLAVLLLLLWWFWPSKPENQQMGRGRFGDMGPVPVRVAEVKQGEFAIELKALGTVTSYNTVNVRSRVDGELVKVLFEEGQQVKAGDLFLALILRQELEEPVAQDCELQGVKHLVHGSAVDRTARDVLERRVYARRERIQALAVVGQGKVRVARLEAAEVFRVAVLGLIEGQALEVPVVAFAQARVVLRR